MIINEMKAGGGIDYAEKVPYDQMDLTPNDPSYSSQWHLNTIGAATAWNSFSTGSTIRIAIVDNAVDRNHTDLSGNLWVNAGEIASNSIDDDGNGYVDDINGYDVADLDNNPNPPNTTAMSFRYTSCFLHHTPQQRWRYLSCPPSVAYRV